MPKFRGVDVMIGMFRTIYPFFLALPLVLASEPSAEQVRFVVLGDIPYGTHQLARLSAIGEGVRDGDYPFVVHYGDIKAGSSRCDDALLQERRAAIYGLLDDRVFFTPGDNDWTDCDAESAGGFDELERLEKLRRLFFANDVPSDPSWRIVRQSDDYPENVRWEYDGLHFVMLHVVGTANGRARILKSDVESTLDAVEARERANLEWLDEAFAEAQVRSADGMVAIMHADPMDIPDRALRNRPCTAEERTDCNPYLSLLQRLTDRADDFDRPVLLVHGSTMSYCFDTGFGGWRAPKLWRLNGPGDFVVIDATVVSFDPRSLDGNPFAVHGLLTGDQVPNCVSR